MKISILFITIFILFTGCSGEKPLDENAVKSFAGPMVDFILKALDAGDYEGFTKDFNEDMLRVVTPSFFDKLKTQISQKAGIYSSSTFQKAERIRNLIRTTYNANYSEQPEGVTITAVFQFKNGKYYIAGFFLDSPNLRN